MPRETKLHIMPFCPSDMRSSKVRVRSILTGDPMLRLVYRELLDVLWEKGGAVSSDPVVLSDELGIDPEEIARCVRILLTIRGALVEMPGGQVSNPRILTDIERDRNFREQAGHSGRFGATRRWGKGEIPSETGGVPVGYPTRPDRVPIGSDDSPTPTPTPTKKNPPISPFTTSGPLSCAGAPSGEQSVVSGISSERALEAIEPADEGTPRVPSAPARSTPPAERPAPFGPPARKTAEGRAARLVGRNLDRFRAWYSLYPAFRRSGEPDCEVIWLGMTDREQDEALRAAPDYAAAWEGIPSNRRRWMPGPRKFLERRLWEHPELWTPQPQESASAGPPLVGANGGAWAPKRDLESAPEPIKDIYRRVQFRGDYSEEEMARLHGWLRGDEEGGMT